MKKKKKKKKRERTRCDLFGQISEIKTDTMDCTKDLAKVHSPEQNRAYQRVSMYHQLLIASQYLSSRFPPIYRPRLPPLVLSHPKGISTKDHFPTAMKKKKIFNTTANLLPNIKITNDICFFFIFAYLLSFFFFFILLSMV